MLSLVLLEIEGIRPVDWDSLFVHLDDQLQNPDPSLRFYLLLSVKQVEAIGHLDLKGVATGVLLLGCNLVADFGEHALECTGRSLALLLVFAGILADESKVFEVDVLD